VAEASLVTTKEEAVRKAEEMGYPVVLKGCSAELTHKTESGMVVINITEADEVARVYDDLTSKGKNLDGILVEKWCGEIGNLLSV